MNRQCKNCGTFVSDNAKFCHNCGGTDFVEEQVFVQQNFQVENVAQSFEQPAQVYDNFNNSFNQQNWQQPMQPQPAPKKRKTWLIILIVVAVLVLAGIGAFAEEYFQYLDNQSNDASYTEGYFDGSVYTNEWADIRCELPDGYNDADSYYYSSAEGENVDCGMYVFSDDLTSFMYISFEKLPSAFYDEDDYLDSATKVFKEALDNSMDVYFADEYETYTIAGYDYTKATCEIDNGISTRSSCFYVRKIGSYMVVINACDATEYEVDALVDNINTFN